MPRALFMLLFSLKKGVPIKRKKMKKLMQWHYLSKAQTT